MILSDVLANSPESVQDQKLPLEDQIINTFQPAIKAYLQ